MNSEGLDCVVKLLLFSCFLSCRWRAIHLALIVRALDPKLNLACLIAILESAKRIVSVIRNRQQLVVAVRLLDNSNAWLVHD